MLLLATGAGPFDRSGFDGIAFLLGILDLVLVGPLISALHVHAVDDLRQGEEPRLASVAKRGIQVLPVVAAATIAAAFGAAFGLLLLVVPGVILFLRWAVAAQSAAIDHQGWSAALTLSRELSRGHYKHVAAVLILSALITGLPYFAVSRLLDADSTTIATFIGGTLFLIVTRSFGALVAALLYFDLRARAVTCFKPSSAQSPPVPDPRPDGGRPKGWYEDPDSPGRMRYWGGAELGWLGSARAPRKRSFWR